MESLLLWPYTSMRLLLFLYISPLTRSQSQTRSLVAFIARLYRSLLSFISASAFFLRLISDIMKLLLHSPSASMKREEDISIGNRAPFFLIPVASVREKLLCSGCKAGNRDVP